jgi:hypothetical protein
MTVFNNRRMSTFQSGRAAGLGTLSLLAISCAAVTPAAPPASAAAPGPGAAPGPAASTSAATAAAGPTSAAEATRRVVFHGACDASGAVVLNEALIAVADDEDNILRVYDSRRGGEPLVAVDVSTAMNLPVKKKSPELDIEAGTRVGEHAFWLTSHGRNSKGKVQESRFRLFATTRPAQGAGLTPVGTPYTQLLEDLLAAPVLRPFGLDAAAKLPPKEPGGLNIEGMTGRHDGRSLWIGFRNPLPQGRALVVAMLNPAAVVGASQKPVFDDPQLLELNGLGVRALSRWRDLYLLVGGPAAGGGASRLFLWDGQGDRPVPVPVQWGDLNPEAFASFPDSDQVLLLSDDGTRLVDGVECKRLKDPAQKRFRGAWIDIPADKRR